MTVRDIAAVNSNIAVVTGSATGQWIALPYKTENFIFKNDGTTSVYVVLTADNTTAVPLPTTTFGAAMGSIIAAGDTLDYKYPGTSSFKFPYLYYVTAPTGLSIKLSDKK